MIAVSFFVLALAPFITHAIKSDGKFTPSQMTGRLQTNMVGGHRWYTAESSSTTTLKKRDLQAKPRQNKGYGEDDEITNGETVDLHKGEFCVDVSTYGEIEYDPIPKEVCDSTFAKVCEDRNEKVIPLHYASIPGLPLLYSIML